jgi:transcriptional regulator with XRE-family HTH domain
MKLGSQIKRLRKSKGIKQKEFAALIGLSPIHYNGVESDRRNTTVKMLEKIAAVTNTQLVITFIEKE